MTREVETVSPDKMVATAASRMADSDGHAGFPRPTVELGVAKTAQKEGFHVVEDIEIVDSITADLITTVVT